MEPSLPPLSQVPEPRPGAPSPQERLIERAIGALGQEFIVVGKSRVRSWKAWLAIGIAVGFAVGVILIANRSGATGTNGAAASSFLSCIQSEVMS